MALLPMVVIILIFIKIIRKKIPYKEERLR